MELTPHYTPLSIIGSMLGLVGTLCLLGVWMTAWSTSVRERGCLFGGVGVLFLIPFLLVNRGPESDRGLKLLVFGILALCAGMALVPHPPLVCVFNNLNHPVVVIIGKERTELDNGSFAPLEGTDRLAIVTDKSGNVIEKVSLPPVDCLYNIKGKGSLFLADYSSLYGEKTVSVRNIRVTALQGANKVYQLPHSRELLKPDQPLPHTKNTEFMLRVEIPLTADRALEYAQARATKEINGQ